MTSDDLAETSLGDEIDFGFKRVVPEISIFSCGRISLVKRKKKKDKLMFYLFIDIPPSLDFLKVPYAQKEKKKKKRTKSLQPFIFLSEQQHENSSPLALASSNGHRRSTGTNLLEPRDTPCAAPQHRKRLRLIRRAIYLPILFGRRAFLLF